MEITFLEKKDFPTMNMKLTHLYKLLLNDYIVQQKSGDSIIYWNHQLLGSFC